MGAEFTVGEDFRGRGVGGALARGEPVDEGQMTVDELVCRLMVVVLAPALRQQVLVLRFQHRDPPDFLAVASQAMIAINYFRSTTICICPHCQFDFETLLPCLRGDHVSTRNGRAPAAGGAACANRGLSRPT